MIVLWLSLLVAASSQAPERQRRWLGLRAWVEAESLDADADADREAKDSSSRWWRVTAAKLPSRSGLLLFLTLVSAAAAASAITCCGNCPLFSSQRREQEHSLDGVMAAPGAPAAVDESLYHDRGNQPAKHHTKKVMPNSWGDDLYSVNRQHSGRKRDSIDRWEGTAMVSHDSVLSAYTEDGTSTMSTLPSHVTVVHNRLTVFATINGILKNVKRVRNRITEKNSRGTADSPETNRLGNIPEGAEANDDKKVQFRGNASFISAMHSARPSAVGPNQSEMPSDDWEETSLEKMRERMRAWSVKVLGDTQSASSPQLHEQELSSSFKQEATGSGLFSNDKASIPAKEALPPQGGEGEAKAAARRRTRTTSWQTASSEQEEEATKWLEAMSGESRGSQEFAAWLHSGQLLCDVANRLQSGVVPKVFRSNQTYRERENVKAFIQACRSLGVPENELFNVNDLYTDSNVPNVTRCILHLAGAKGGGASTAARKPLP